MPSVSLAAVLARAAALGWPQIVYRSPVMNERYHLHDVDNWQEWALGPPLDCDLPVVMAVLVELREGD